MNLDKARKIYKEKKAKKVSTWKHDEKKQSKKTGILKEVLSSKQKEIEWETNIDKARKKDQLD